MGEAFYGLASALSMMAGVAWVGYGALAITRAYGSRSRRIYKTALYDHNKRVAINRAYRQARATRT